jgi:hypothetical protein
VFLFLANLGEESFQWLGFACAVWYMWGHGRLRPVERTYAWPFTVAKNFYTSLAGVDSTVEQDSTVGWKYVPDAKVSLQALNQRENDLLWGIRSYRLWGDSLRGLELVLPVEDVGSQAVLVSGAFELLAFHPGLIAFRFDGPDSGWRLPDRAGSCLTGSRSYG